MSGRYEINRQLASDTFVQANDCGPKVTVSQQANMIALAQTSALLTVAAALADIADAIRQGSTP